MSRLRHALIESSGALVSRLVMLLLQRHGRRRRHMVAGLLRVLGRLLPPTGQLLQLKPVPVRVKEAPVPRLQRRG